MHDIFFIVLELHLQKLFPIDDQIIPHTQDVHHKFPVCHMVTPSFKNHKNFLLLFDSL